jgi:hypothetical protein
MYLSIITTAFLTLSTNLVSASVGVLDINTLLHPDLNGNLFNPTSNQPSSIWSHEPHCRTSTTLNHIGEKFCVYTSNITSDYGLSLILAPKHAQKAKKHLAKTSLDKFLKQHKAEILRSEPTPWKVVDIPGKGKGLVATRRIEKHETFMIDHAAIILDTNVDDSILGPLMKIAVDQLQTPDMFPSLSSKPDVHSSSTLEQNIMQANAFGTTLAGIPTRSLFPLVAVRLILPSKFSSSHLTYPSQRINHSCAPNAFVLHAPTGTHIAVRSYTSISAGEEITISCT